MNAQIINSLSYPFVDAGKPQAFSYSASIQNNIEKRSGRKLLYLIGHFISPIFPVGDLSITESYWVCLILG